jgi:hypothetical protein
MARNEHIVIRSADATDENALAVLAVIDGGRQLPSGQILVAEVGGRVRAAIGSNGSAIADPFWPSADLVSMLRMHAGVSGRHVRRAPRFAQRRAVMA